MDLFPIDIISIIRENIKNYKDLHSLKLTCKHFNENVSYYSIIRMKIKNKLNVEKNIVEYCANIECYDETEDIFNFTYRIHQRKYIHYHQPAMNYDTVYINRKSYKIFSLYCCECYKKHVLIGDKKENLVREIKVEGFVDIFVIADKHDNLGIDSRAQAIANLQASVAALQKHVGNV